MKEYLIEWETCYCEDYPERTGQEIIKANSEKEAIEKVILPYHSVITGVKEQKGF